MQLSTITRPFHWFPSEICHHLSLHPTQRYDLAEGLGAGLRQRNGPQILSKWRWMGLHVQSSRQAVPDKWVFTRTLDLSRSQPKKQSHTLHVCEY